MVVELSWASNNVSTYMFWGHFVKLSNNWCGWLQLFVCCCLLLSGCRKSEDQALGTLEWDRVNGRAPASETIVGIYVQEGQRVDKDTLIMKLDDRKVVQQLQEVKAKKQKAEWNLQELKTGPRPQTIAEAEARLDAAKATLENDYEIYQRQQRLYNNDFTSRQQLDNSLNRYLNSKERVNELSENLDLLLVGTRVEQLEQARLEVESLSARLENLKLLLADYSIYAARRGLVDSIPYKIGDKPPAQAVVCTILAGDVPWARVYIPESYRSRMIPGKEFLLRIDGQDTSFKAQLRTVSSEASFTPYFALSERDRSRLSYVAKLDLVDERARSLTAGTPVQLVLGE